MCKVVKGAAITAAAAAYLVFGLAAAAEIPADKAEISIDLIAGKKGAVTFPHAKHIKEFKKQGGAAIVCKDCHHTLKTDDGGADKPKPCAECHVKVGEAEKTIDGKKASVLAVDKGGGAIDQKSVVFHARCVEGCHKAMKDEGKKITACKTCHKGSE